MLVRVSSDQPTNPQAWNSLAEINGNLIQSTYYDKVQAFFRQRPVYFELWENDHLLAGVKLYRWSSRKLGTITEALSKTITQFGELLADSDAKRETVDPNRELSLAAYAYIRANKIVTCRVSGYYGGYHLLLCPGVTKANADSKFLVASIDLSPPENELWQAIHPDHRRKITKATRQNATFGEEDNVDGFLALMTKSFADQPNKQPDQGYLRHFYRELAVNHLARLFFVKQGSKALAAALVIHHGPTAYYAFGGTERNSIGAANLLHWEVMKLLKTEGRDRYVLGQVADQNQEDNERFSVGISRFKMRFGTAQISSHSSEFIYRRGYNRLWNTLVKILNRRPKPHQQLRSSTGVR